MVTSRGILVNKLVTSKDIRNLPYVLSCLISSMEVKLSLKQGLQMDCIAASSNGLLSTTDIRSLEKCYKK